MIKNFKNIKYGPALEDDSEVLKWIKNLPKPNHNFINGEWSKSFSRQTLSSINPANNKKLFDLSISSKADIDKAVKAAKNAFPSWSKTNPYKRSKYLLGIISHNKTDIYIKEYDQLVKILFSTFIILFTVTNN